MSTAVTIQEILHQFTMHSVCFRIIFAAFCGAILGIEPFLRYKPAGMRTYILVCMGSAITVLIGLYASEVLKADTDPLRIAAQVVSGIGFLGGGTILLRGRIEVTGLTTAAGLWTSASIGIAIGIGFYSVAILCTLIVLFTMVFLQRTEQSIKKRRTLFNVYIEADDVANMSILLSELRKCYTVKTIDVTAPRSAYSGHAGIEAILHIEKGADRNEIMKELEKIDHVVYVLKSI